MFMGMLLLVTAGWRHRWPAQQQGFVQSTSAPPTLDLFAHFWISQDLGGVRSPNPVNMASVESHPLSHWTSKPVLRNLGDAMVCRKVQYQHFFWRLCCFCLSFHLSILSIISPPTRPSPPPLPTIFMASGYRGSMSTPLLVATLSTSSLSAARLISFPFRSATQSRKSNSTQHCCSFLQNRSCNSATGASGRLRDRREERERERKRTVRQIG